MFLRLAVAWSAYSEREHGSTLALWNTFAPVLTLVMPMKGDMKGIVERLATVPQGPQAETLRRFSISINQDSSHEKCS